jgi:PAS domain S-box-containing protein
MRQTSGTQQGSNLRYPTSCALLAGIVRGARSLDLPVEDLDGLPVPLATIEDPKASIEWRDACTVFERLEELADGPAGLRALGQALPDRQVLGPLTSLLRIAITPSQLYKLLARWYGPANLSSMTTTFRVDDDGLLHLTTTIDPRCEDCPQLFHVSHGALEALPTLIGLEPSAVEPDISVRRGAFIIRPPPSATLAALLMRGPFGLGRAQWTIDELAHQQSKLEKTNEELKASEDRFRRLAENTHDMLAEWSPDGRCVYVSPNVQRVLGVRPDEFRARAWELLHPDDVAVTRELMRQRFHAGGSGHIVFRLRVASGEHRWFENTSNATTTETGERRVVTVSRDVTQRRELESQLHQSQKLEALGRLAGGVAHDFNNLLTIIGGASEALLETVPPNGEQHEDLKMILEATDRAAGLTRQLLSFGKQRTYQHQPLDLGAVATGMQLMLSRLLREGIDFAIDVPDELPLVLADAGQIEQVIVNLTVNAIDALPHGGRLRIRLRGVELDGTRKLISTIERPVGPHVELSVIDDGVGMDPATLTRIFDPFFTTKELGRGTGLGLATVHGVVEQLGGHLAVTSASGKGTEISVLLPTYRKSEFAEPSTAPTPARRTGSETILLVDDELAARELMRRQLTAQGYEVIVAENADAASEAYRAAARVDLLLTDLSMPGRDGLALARELRAIDPQLKVLFISGYAPTTVAGPLLDPDHNLLSKPFRAERLTAKVRDLLDA